MKLRRFETPSLAHYAYLLADEGVGVLVDPRRDVDEYLHAARSMGVRIDYVLETHRHEDFVMGSTHLAARTGAKIVNGIHDCFGHGDVRLADGDSFQVGRLEIVGLHTPGHTPESMCYAVYDGATPDHAWAVFTGDTLFFGDTGRTDLPGEAVAKENAARIYDSIHDQIVPLGDEALVLPAHGPAPVFGRGMTERPCSSIGSERLYNKVFCLDREQFIAFKGGSTFPRPPYFRTMEEVNLLGGRPPNLGAGDVRLYAPTELKALLAKHRGAIVFDTRDPEAFAAGHIPGAYSIWLDGLPNFAGFVATEEPPIFLCGRSDQEVDAAVQHLARIGLDKVCGSVRGGFRAWRDAGLPTARTGLIDALDLTDCIDAVTILDVREEAEFEAGHIPHSRNVFVGHLEERMPSIDLDPDQTIVVTCGMGHRASLAASILARAGFTDVRNLVGGMKAWTAQDLRTDHGDAQAA